MGFFYRTIRMVENGIKPAYVFDGKPPELKSGVVSARDLRFLVCRHAANDRTCTILLSSLNGSREGKRRQNKAKRPRKLVSSYLNFGQAARFSHCTLCVRHHGGS